jgi:hypothetical protein
MRLSLLAPFGIAALLGVGTAAMDAPDANALARKTTVVETPSGTTVVKRTRPSRLALARRWHGARGSVICRTDIVNGVRVHRCF